MDKLQEPHEVHHESDIISALHAPILVLVLVMVVEGSLDSLGRSVGDVLVDSCAGPQHLLHRCPGRQVAGRQHQPRIIVAGLVRASGGGGSSSGSARACGTVVMLVLENKLREGLFELVRL